MLAYKLEAGDIRDRQKAQLRRSLEKNLNRGCGCEEEWRQFARKFDLIRSIYISRSTSEQKKKITWMIEILRLYSQSFAVVILSSVQLRCASNYLRLSSGCEWAANCIWPENQIIYVNGNNKLQIRWLGFQLFPPSLKKDYALNSLRKRRPVCNNHR